jgi:hypothetical protein
MFYMPDPSQANAPGHSEGLSFEPIDDRDELRKIVLELTDDIIRG